MVLGLRPGAWAVGEMCRLCQPAIHVRDQGTAERQQGQGSRIIHLPSGSFPGRSEPINSRQTQPFLLPHTGPGLTLSLCSLTHFRALCSSPHSLLLLMTQRNKFWVTDKSKPRRTDTSFEAGKRGFSVILWRIPSHGIFLEIHK